MHARPAVRRPAEEGDADHDPPGLEVAWAGRVAEIADHSQHGIATKTTGGEGLRALLRDTLIQMIYVDRDLTRWGSPSLARQTSLNSSSFSLASAQVAADPSTNQPAILQPISDSWVSPWRPVAESWYDAGPLNLITKVFYYLTTNEPVQRRELGRGRAVLL